MAETPLGRLARVLGGVALLQGRLGHQVLGQLMIAGTSDLGIAGAAAAVAGTSRVRHPAAQAAIRTAVPALALYSMFERREEILRRRESQLLARTREIAEHDFDLAVRAGVLERSNAKLQARNTSLEDDIVGLEKHRQLSNDMHDAFVEALSRARRILTQEQRRCQAEKAILQSRNDGMRKVLAAVTERLRAVDSTSAGEIAAPQSDLKGLPAVKKKRAKRREQQRRAKRRIRKREK